METITMQEFMEKLDKGATLKLVRDLNFFEISQIFDLIINKDSFEWEKTIKGYRVVHADSAGDVILDETFSDFDSAKEYLSKYDLLTGNIVEIDGQTSIGASFAHFGDDDDDDDDDDDFVDDCNLNNLCMSDLLEKYGDCDTFSLSAYVSKAKLSEQDALSIIDGCVAKNEAFLYKMYKEALKKYDLPPFNKIVCDISEECEHFIEENYDRYNIQFPNIGNRIAGFITEEIGKTTKYSEPDSFYWHAYNALGNMFDQISLIESMIVPNGETEVSDDFNLPDYDKIRPYLIRTDITDGNHCTWGPLFQNLYFKLNDVTKEWLLSRRDIFDFSDCDYQDLAFYKDGKLQFSSCTHEFIARDCSQIEEDDDD